MDNLRSLIAQAKLRQEAAETRSTTAAALVLKKAEAAEIVDLLSNLELSLKSAAEAEAAASELELAANGVVQLSASASIFKPIAQGTLLRHSAPVAVLAAASSSRKSVPTSGADSTAEAAPTPLSASILHAAGNASSISVLVGGMPLSPGANNARADDDDTDARALRDGIAASLALSDADGRGAPCGASFVNGGGGGGDVSAEGASTSVLEELHLALERIEVLNIDAELRRSTISRLSQQAGVLKEQLAEGALRITASAAALLAKSNAHSNLELELVAAASSIKKLQSDLTDAADKLAAKQASSGTALDAAKSAALRGSSEAEGAAIVAATTIRILNENITRLLSELSTAAAAAQTQADTTKRVAVLTKALLAATSTASEAESAAAVAGASLSAVAKNLGEMHGAIAAFLRTVGSGTTTSCTQAVVRASTTLLKTLASLSAKPGAPIMAFAVIAVKSGVLDALTAALSVTPLSVTPLFEGVSVVDEVAVRMLLRTLGDGIKASLTAAVAAQEAPSILLLTTAKTIIDATIEHRSATATEARSKEIAASLAVP